jgi:DNA-binding CsgD family transcriptional regulator
MADVDIEQVYKLTLKKNTPAEIALIMGCSDTHVRNIIDEHLPFLKDLDIYEKHKTDIMKGVQKMSLNYLIKKMPNASFKDLTYFFAIVEDKINLREGKSTQNIGIGLNIRLEDLVTKKEKMEKELLSSGIAHSQLAYEITKKVALPEITNLPFYELREGNLPKCTPVSLEQLMSPLF